MCKAGDGADDLLRAAAGEVHYSGPSRKTARAHESGRQTTSNGRNRRTGEDGMVNTSDGETYAKTTHGGLTRVPPYQ